MGGNSVDRPPPAAPTSPASGAWGSYQATPVNNARIQGNLFPAALRSSVGAGARRLRKRHDTWRSHAALSQGGVMKPDGVTFEARGDKSR